MSGIIFLFLSLLAVLGAAFFAVAETTVIHLKPSRVVRLRKRGGATAAQAKQLEEVLTSKEQFLGSTLIGTLLCHTAAAIFLVAALDTWAINRLIAALLTVILISADLLIFGQLAPHCFARQYPLKAALIFASAMRITLRWFSPLSKSFGRISSGLVRLVGRANPPQFSFVSREQLKVLAPRAKKGDSASADATRMIHGVFDMRQKSARDLMVPLDKATVCPADATVDAVCALTRATGFSRMPVIDRSPVPMTGSHPSSATAPEAAAAKQWLSLPCAQGRIIGIVNVYEILFSNETIAPNRSVKDFVRRPVLLNETDPPDRALQRLRAARLPLAIVVNANQQAVGIITVDNIVAQIVGKATA